MEAGAVVKPYELAYSDLIKLSSDTLPSSTSADEIRRRQIVSEAVTKNLGPTGQGLITITGVPGASAIREALLPLARELALLPNEVRKRILKEHGLGSDVPLKNLDRIVSSFATQLKYGHCWDLPTSIEENMMVEPLDDKFKNLGSSLKELGFCMIHLGLRLARICDRAIGGQELEKSLLESCTAKGRLIHYHSAIDSKLIKKAGAKKGLSSSGNQDCSISGDNPSNLWQQWHYDYGIFTILTCPMLISTFYDQSEKGGICDLKSYECPSGHSFLQIFDPNTNEVITVKTPAESFIVQVGESADVLSKGKLRSTLHSVCRPVEMENLSREIFVVFLQPPWTKVFDLTDYPMEGQRQPKITSGQKQQNEEIHNIVPPLRSRLKNGMTFAEFSQATTKQYYGGGGLQTNR